MCDLVFCLVPCLIVVFTGIVITLSGKRVLLLCFSLTFCLYTVCRGLFALPFGAIGRLRSVIVALTGHFC